MLGAMFDQVLYVEVGVSPILLMLVRLFRLFGSPSHPRASRR